MSYSHIFIVTSGEHEDYSIEGVFSTEKKAQEFMYYNDPVGFDYNPIEKHKIDLIKNKKVFIFCMHVLDTGEVTRVYKTDNIQDDKIIKRELIACCFAGSYRAARQKAKEKWQKYITAGWRTWERKM